jgi:broad specificity phosphatase PhoE
MLKAKKISCAWGKKTTVNDFNSLINESPSTPLTRWGVFQAQRMAGVLQHTHIERIYTSPFDRALQTANIIGNAFHLTPQVVPDLREVLPHHVTDIELSKQEQRLGKLLVHSYLRMVKPDGKGEKLHASMWRTRKVWKYITADHAREIAVVSHYGLISLILLYLHSHRAWRVLSKDLANGGVSVVVKER